MALDPDRLTDYTAVVISAIATLWVIGLATHMYLTDGQITSQIMYLIGGLVLISIGTLFGVEKLKKVLNLGE